MVAYEGERWKLRDFSWYEENSDKRIQAKLYERNPKTL